MKKRLLFRATVAALVSAAGTAHAQASAPAAVQGAQAPKLMTFYGLVDMSIQYVNNTDAGTGKSITGKTGNAIETSRVGLRVMKLLDGGYFVGGNLEATLFKSSSNSGTTLNRIFDRGAYVSVGNTTWGRIDLGYAANPMINVRTVPMAGNSVNSATAYAINWPEFYTAKAITYSTPNLAGFRAQAQYGARDSVPNTNNANRAVNGSIVAGIADYSTPVYGLSLAAQRRNAGDGTAATDRNAFQKTTYLAAARYTTGDLNLGLSWWRNAVDADGAPGLNPAIRYAINAYQVGFSYAVSPAWLAGASYSANTVDSRMLNIQVHHAFDKATTFYTQVSRVDNSSPAGRASGPFGNFYTVNAPGMSDQGLTPFGVNGGKAAAVGVGVIYRF